MKIIRNDIDPANNVSYLEYSKNMPLILPTFNKWTNWYEYIRVANTHAPAPDARGFLDLPDIVGVDRYQTYKQAVDKDRQITIDALNTLVTVPKIDKYGNMIRDDNGNRILDSVLFRELYKYPKAYQAGFLDYLNRVIGTGKFSDPKYRKMAEIVGKQLTGVPPEYIAEKKK